MVTLYSLQWGIHEEVCIKQRNLDAADGTGIARSPRCAANGPGILRGNHGIAGKTWIAAARHLLHLVGQAVCDRIDERHKAILPAHIWGDGDAEGVGRRAAEELIRTAQAAKALGIDTVVGFTGSPIWHLLYAFPPVTPQMIDEGYQLFAERFTPILDAYEKLGIRFALEVHPPRSPSTPSRPRGRWKRCTITLLSASTTTPATWATRG